MTAQNILNVAASQIGVKERPANSNKVKYNTAYYGHEVSGSGYPWCCVFVWWVFKTCGASELFYGGKKTAYCPTVEGYYKKLGKWHSSGKPGDLVLFDFSRKGIAGHIGIVEKVNSDGSYTTIEGNTGSGNDANGGAVMRRTRYKSTIRGFARPDYAAAVSFTETPVSLIGSITANVLNIRKQPSAGAVIIGKHSFGDVVNISAKTDNGWYRVDYPAIGIGYISSQYVSVLEPIQEKPAEPVAPVVEPNDSTPDDWTQSAVHNAVNTGILCGDAGGNLKLHKACTRQEVIVFLHRLYKNLK